MPQLEEVHYLLLVEAGAEAPAWLDPSKGECLDQGGSEPHVAFVERCSAWLLSRPETNTVVVALNTTDQPSLEDRVQALATSIVAILHSRPRARLLFGAPADTPERQRRRLLGWIAGMAQTEHGPCIVGAHFSANPPSSSKIPVLLQ